MELLCAAYKNVVKGFFLKTDSEFLELFLIYFYIVEQVVQLLGNFIKNLRSKFVKIAVVIGIDKFFQAFGKFHCLDFVRLFVLAD